MGDIQTEFINKHVFSLFNYNVIEGIFVGISVLINLAGIMFDSPYLGKDSDGNPNRKASILAYITVGTIISSMIYFVIIFANEVLSVASKKAMKGQILWHKVKRKHMRTILHMAKENDHGHRLLRSKSKFAHSHNLMALERMRDQGQGPKVAPQLPAAAPTASIRTTAMVRAA